MTTTYTLRWTSPEEVEFTRVFPHAGSAISWARRKIRKGEVLMDRAELTVAAPAGSLAIGGVHTATIMGEATYEIYVSDLREWQHNKRVFNLTVLGLGEKLAEGPSLKRLPRKPPGVA